MAAQRSNTNNFPAGECTKYANERYHTLTGYYVPWGGNAYQWASQSVLSGWIDSPYPVVPSIIVLQPGTQGADSTYGHVGIVEKINSNGSVTTTDLNWGRTAQIRSTVQTVTFKSGPGVSFVYAQDASGKPLASSGFSTLDSSTSTSNTFVTTAGTKVTQALAPSADVTTLLYVLDQVLALKNPFDMAGAQLPQVNLPGGISFTDPVAWGAQFGQNVVDDLSASVIRVIFLGLGFLVMYKVLSNFIDFGAIGRSISSGAETVAKGAVLLA